MSHDIVADALNMIWNVKKARKDTVKVKIISNLLIEILKIMKLKKAIKKYKINPEEKSIEITIGNLSKCQAIKPRFTVDKNQIEKYRRRYLPARNLGQMIVSTNQGIMTHEKLKRKKLEVA